MRSRPPWADAGTCHGMGRELKMENHTLGFKQLVQHPTHIGGNTLDLVLTRGVDIADLVVSSYTSALSDHFLLTFQVVWWNELPANVRITELLTSFRKRLKTHLFRVHLDSA
ncbi:unnamed protein product [Boreogadus saida]